MSSGSRICTWKWRDTMSLAASVRATSTSSMDAEVGAWMASGHSRKSLTIMSPGMCRHW